MCTSSDDALYFYDVSWKYLERFSHKITVVEFQRRIIPNMYRYELRFLCCAHRLMMLYISIKFHANILKGFQVIERTRNDHCIQFAAEYLCCNLPFLANDNLFQMFRKSVLPKIPVFTDSVSLKFRFWHTLMRKKNVFKPTLYLDIDTFQLDAVHLNFL